MICFLNRFNNKKCVAKTVIVLMGGGLVATLLCTNKDSSKMIEYLFLDKTTKPTDENLKEALSKTYKYWSEIKDDISSQYGAMIPEWKFYDKKTGWTLKNMLKKRNLFFFKPYKGYFDLTFVFGDKAIIEIEKSDISENLIQEIISSKKYMEGRVLTVRVSKKSDLRNIYKLIEIKIQN